MVGFQQKPIKKVRPNKDAENKPQPKKQKPKEKESKKKSGFGLGLGGSSKAKVEEPKKIKESKKKKKVFGFGGKSKSRKESEEIIEEVVIEEEILPDETERSKPTVCSLITACDVDTEVFVESSYINWIKDRLKVDSVPPIVDLLDNPLFNEMRDFVNVVSNSKIIDTDVDERMETNPVVQVNVPVNTEKKKKLEVNVL